MNINDLPFATTDWNNVEKTEHTGETGIAYWQTKTFGNIRVRVVEYSAGYLEIIGVVKGIYYSA